MDIVRAGLPGETGYKTLVSVASKTGTSHKDDFIASAQLNTTYKVMHQANVAFGSPRIVYGNYIVMGNTANNITVKASIQTSGGHVIPITFNGAASITLLPGQTATSDPLGVSFAQDETFWTRNLVTVGTVGDQIPGGFDLGDWIGSPQVATNEGYFAGDGTTGSPAWVGGVRRAFHPLAILGRPATPGPSFLMFGDGRMAGYSNYNDYNGNGFGMIAGRQWKRSVLISTGHFNHFYDVRDKGSNWRRLLLAEHCTHAIVSFGVYDIMDNWNTWTLADIQQAALDCVNELTRMGIKVYVCTIGPRTNGADYASQTPTNTAMGSTGIRTTFNDWLRTKPAPVSGVFDLAQLWGEDVGYHKWKSIYFGGGDFPNNIAQADAANLINLTSII